jgi:8-oxo-dGTP pyrophosphatase MutT (NUDIX family)
MTKIHYGERITKGARLRFGCSAIIFDPTRTKVLLTRRSDNGLWCLPGGAMEAGESVEETCVREVFEETGLNVKVNHPVGIYSNRDMIVEYPDGNRFQIVVLHFEVDVIGGAMSLSDETTDIRYFALSEIEPMELHGQHKQRILDSLAFNGIMLVR